MTEKRPAFVTLRLTSPRQEHPSAKWIQRLINKSSPKYAPLPVEVDGVFGAETATEVEEMLYRLGSPSYQPAIGPQQMAVLWAWEQGGKLPEQWRANRIKRMAIGFKRGWGISARAWLALHPGSKPYSGAAACEVARSWVNQDYDEAPPGSNNVPELQALGRSLGVRSTFSAMGYAWCAYAYYLEGLVAGSTTARMGLVDGTFWPLYTPYILTYAQKGQYGHKLVSASSAREGDGVLFNFGAREPVQHIGRLKEPPGQRVVTWDGNTSLTSDDNGGAMMLRDRSSSTVVAYFRDL